MVSIGEQYFKGNLWFMVKGSRLTYGSGFKVNGLILVHG